jgi:type IV pilus assembly protein PilB
MTEGHVRIGDLLVRARLLSQADLERALAAQKMSGRRLGEEVVRLGLVTEIQLTQVLSNQLAVPWVSLYHVDFTRELLTLVPAEVAEKYCMIPIYVRHVRKVGNTLFVAMNDPTNADALEVLRAASGLPVKPMIAPPSDIRSAIRVYYFGTKPPEALDAGVEEEPMETVGSLVRFSEREADDAFASMETRASEPTEAAAPKEEPVARKKDAPKDGEKSSAKEKRSAPPGKSKRPPKAAEVKDRGPKMVTLTLLDGTTVRLPAPGSGAKTEGEGARSALTGQDIINALRAKAEGADVSDVLGDTSLELLFATLLSVLMRKGLVADWEFVDELAKKR